MIFSNSFHIASHEAKISFLFWTSFFFSRRFYLSTRFLFVWTHLPNLFQIFCVFFVLFWMLWMLVIVHNLCYVPQASQTRMCPRNESDVAHTLPWKLMLKRWLKSFRQSVQKMCREGKKQKKLEWQLQTFLR